MPLCCCVAQEGMRLVGEGPSGMVISVRPTAGGWGGRVWEGQATWQNSQDETQRSTRLLLLFLPGASSQHHLSGCPHPCSAKELGEINIPSQTTEKYLKKEKKFPSKTGRAGRGQVCTELAPFCWERKGNCWELCISSHLFCIR